MPLLARLPGQQPAARASFNVEVTEREDGGFEMSLRPPCSRAVHLCRPGAALPFAAVLPGDGVAEAVLTTGISQFLSLYNAALIGRILLTWFPNPPQAIVGPLATVVDPYLNLFRGIIPPIGGTIDLSPILAFVVLDLFSNAAAALPAEVDEQGRMKRPTAAPGPWSRVRQAWARRGAATVARRAAERQQQAAGQ
eukprot:scaffold4.g4765.t1